MPALGALCHLYLTCGISYAEEEPQGDWAGSWFGPLNPTCFPKPLLSSPLCALLLTHTLRQRHICTHACMHARTHACTQTFLLHMLTYNFWKHTDTFSLTYVASQPRVQPSESSFGHCCCHPFMSVHFEKVACIFKRII